MIAARARWPRRFNLSLLVLLFAVFVARAHGAEQTAPPGAVGLGRGINILGYDGIWQGAENAPFRLENLTAIQKAGFSHVRINFFGFKYMGSEDILDEAVMNRLDATILIPVDRAVTVATA